MPSLNRKLLFALVPACVLGVLVFIALEIARSPSGPSLPNPNGYDDFVKAGRAVEGDASTFADLELGALRTAILTNAEPLRLLALGLTRQCSFPTDMGVTNSDLAFGDLSKLKRLAQLLCAEGRLAAMEGRPIDAARAYIEVMRLGNEISRGGLVINRLVGIACEAIGSGSLAKLAPALGSEPVGPLLGQLEELDARRVSFEEIRRNESRFVRHELFKERNPLKWITGWWEARAIIAQSETRHKVVIAHERLLATEIALRSYRSRTTQPPTRLADLSTNYLSKVPMDPFSEGTLVYCARGTNWLLYSVGPDGIDDGGKPIARGLKSKGDVFFDSPW